MSVRELMIRFIDDGEVFNEIDETRNYYLSEAESIVEKIKVRLTNEKRVSSPKGFECWVDGKQLIISSVRFENGQSLEEQLKQTILEHKEWEEDLKNKYINKINEYASKERELMVHREFKAFVIRFDQYMGNPKNDPFPLLLRLERLKDLFDGIFVNISSGFYSELEVIMGSIKESFQIIVKQTYDELSEQDHEEYEGSWSDFLRVRVITWLGNDENFNRFKNYLIAHYESVPKSRIRAIYPRYEPFQEMQDYLFSTFAKTQSFDEAYRLSNELIQSFYEKYDDILFGGFAIKNDDMVKSLIFSPVVKNFFEVIEKRKEETLPKDSNIDKGMVDDEEELESAEEINV